MRNPGQVNIASIQDALSHAMNTATTDAARWSLRSDAECHRDAILDAYRARRRPPHQTHTGRNDAASRLRH